MLPLSGNYALKGSGIQYILMVSQTVLSPMRNSEFGMCVVGLEKHSFALFVTKLFTSDLGIPNSDFRLPNFLIDT